MSLIKQFSKDSLIYGLGKGLKKFIGILLLPVYTRALSPEEFGILDTLGSGVFLLIVFFNFGLNSAVSFFYFKPEDENERGSILYTVFIMRLLVVIPSLLLCAFAWPISRLLFGSDLYATAILISFLQIPFSMLLSEQEMVYRLKRNAWGYNIVTILKALINIACGILLVVQFKMGVNGAQLATLFSTLVVVVYSYFSYTSRQYFPKFNMDWAKQMFKFGFPLIWAGLAVWVYQLSDRFFIIHYKGLEEVGFYSIGSTFSQPIGLLNLAVQMSFGTLFYQMFNKEKLMDKPESKAFMRRILYLYLSIVSFFAVGLSVFSYEIVGFITTEKYIPGIVAIPFLTVSLMFAQMVEVVPQGISIAKKTWYYTWVTLAAATVNAGLNFIFIPHLGFLGAAMTTLLSTMTYFILADYFSRKHFDCEFSRFKLYSYVLITLATAALFPILDIKADMHFGFWKIFICIAFFFVPIIWGLLQLDDIRTGIKLIRARIRKK
jgi:O-antigen/teichoic acid export membrane protein